MRNDESLRKCSCCTFPSRIGFARYDGVVGGKFWKRLFGDRVESFNKLATSPHCRMIFNWKLAGALLVINKQHTCKQCRAEL